MHLPLLKTQAPGRLRILILDGRRHRYVDEPDLERAVLGPNAQVELAHVDSVADLPRSALACDGLICWHLVPLDADALARFTQCRVLVRAAMGVDNIDLAAARRAGISVANVPDYGTEEVADHTLALALALLRRIPQANAVVRGGSWDWRELGPLPRIANLVVGLVGLGRIGTAVARRFQALGCRTVFHDPWLGSGWEKSLGVTRCETLQALLEQADLVSLHAPLTPETRYLIGAPELACLAGKYLLNTARGDLIDPCALRAAMAHAPLAGLGLDVYSDERDPPPPELRGPRVLWSPHMAFYSRQSLEELRHKAAVGLQTLLAGQHHRDRL
ncbi:C-terminal binding protein [Pseudomonas sp. DC3200b2]|uniref:C-terminal binding protein n=1 Tax=Pseudomonas sp. DC3200b2 TaxID=2804669 RepID=UPI003CED4508